MKMTIRGKSILTDENEIYATCDVPEKALEMMERAWYLNDVKRQYTASARLFAKVEALPGFKWSKVVQS